MTTKEFYLELDVILHRPRGTVKGDESLTDFVEWDSLSKLLFIDMMDDKVGVIVSAGDLLNSKTVKDLLNLCEGKVKD